MATIYGAPEACGAAAMRILEIIRKEESDQELPLRGGPISKKIVENFFVSNMNDPFLLTFGT